MPRPRKRGKRAGRLTRQAVRQAPVMETQRWHGRGAFGPNGQCLALAPKYLAETLEDGYRNTWERRVIMVSEPITERKRVPVPVQNWEASEQAKRYRIADAC